MGIAGGPFAFSYFGCQPSGNNKRVQCAKIKTNEQGVKVKTIEYDEGGLKQTLIDGKVRELSNTKTSFFS